MFIGVYAHLKQTDELLLKHLFNNIDLSKHIVKISNSQVWKDENGTVTFAETNYNGSAFKDITSTSQHLVMQLNINAYVNEKLDFSIYIYDCYYIEIYCCNNLLNSFTENIKNFLTFDDYELIAKDKVKTNNGIEFLKLLE